MELLTAAQMRAIEQAAIDSGEVTGLELMERAGQGVVDAIFEEWPEMRKTSHRAVVLCGPGNNGGDGFVVARLLKEWGWEVEVFLCGDPDKLPPDAKVNYERWTSQQFVRPFSAGDNENSRNKLLDILRNSDLILDAIIGTGLTRGLPNTWAMHEVVHAIFDDGLWWYGADFGPRIVSVDIVSGLCADSGKILAGDAKLAAHLTITFHGAKHGHYLEQGPRRGTKLRICDIGLPRSDLTYKHPAEIEGTQLTTKPIRHPWKSDLGKAASNHKYTHGHALILSGGPGKTGAARLAARSALRIGAGLVTIACPKNALAEVAAQITAIMCRPLDGSPGLRETLEDERLNALCLGPGLGLGPDTQTLVLEALKANRATVLDADALTRFERNPHVLFDALHENSVLTPHAGEFKRLFPDIAEKLDALATTGPAYSKVDATREAAARAGCTILFKGPDTVIADQTGRCAINASAYDRAVPWLATAGSGDVLAGFITGLLARGFPPMQAAETAAWLHTECALSFGPGLIAEDLPEELPKIFRNLLP